MICLSQGSLHSLSASSWRCDKGTIGHEPLNSNLHVGLHLFVWITYIYVLSWKKPHILCNHCLCYFVWGKCHDLITAFLENKKKFPYCLQSAYVKKIEILTLKYCPRTNPPTSNHHQHTNFVKGTLCYLVFLKCAQSILGVYYVACWYKTLHICQDDWWCMREWARCMSEGVK